MICDHCRKPLTFDEEHTFCGYGYRLVFCEEHCPREYDGWTCEKDHKVSEEEG